MAALGSSRWRISHALSHHLYPNTLQGKYDSFHPRLYHRLFIHCFVDYEVSFFYPSLESMVKHKNFYQKNMVPILYHLVFFFGIPMEWTMRAFHFILRMESPLVEDTIPLFYLALMAINSDTFVNGFLLFALMQVCVILL